MLRTNTSYNSIPTGLCKLKKEEKLENIPSMDEAYSRACKYRIDWYITPADFCEHELEFLRKNKNLTLKDRADFFEGIQDREFDIGPKMLIATDNSLRNGKTPYIFGDKLPKVFEGQDKKEVAKKNYGNSF